MNFAKLKHNIDITQYNTKEVVQSYGKNISGVWRGIKYYNIENTETDKLWNLIPENYHSDFFINLMSINSNIPPHTDSGILCTINAYIQPCNCSTTFYSVTGTAVTERVENQTNGEIFNKSCLTKIDEFTACTGEVYLLNVTVPHEVISRENFAVERTAMCLQSKTKTFNDVYSILKSANKI